MSQTQTQTQAAVSPARVLTRPNRSVQQSRAYDHIYDSVYQVSGETVHNRHVTRAVAGRTANVPSSDNMFSDLVHHPRSHVETRRDDPVPPNMARDFATRLVLTQQTARQDFAESQPEGTHRYRFMGNPVVPDGGATGTDRVATGLVLSSHASRAGPMAATARAHAAHQAAQATRTVGTQSDYRESETQTDPWTPEYVVRPGSAPEVLTLASLSYGHGLPAGLNEVIMIERARAKRAWEKTLPEVTDETKAQQRMRMMEEQDAKEWKWRAEEIEAIQAQRMALVEQLVGERQRVEAQQVSERLESVLDQRRNEREQKQNVLQHKGLRQLRKLQKERDNVEIQKPDRSLVAGCANAASTLPVGQRQDDPFQRGGVMGRYEVFSGLTNTFHGLLELEASLPPSMTHPRVTRPPKRRHPRGTRDHRDDRYQVKLESILAQAKLPPNPAPLNPLRLLERIPTPPTRGPVGSVPVQAAGADEREQGVILLQRLLRGRAEQAAMDRGRTARQELIDELRTTHALEHAEQEIKAQEMVDLKEVQARVSVQAHAKRAAESAVQDVVGQHAGKMLDFLSKELVRLQEERRIHAFAMLADRQRREREAAETGRRAREVHRRAQTDEVFRQMVGVHEESVDTFLEDILLGAQSAAADEVAREEIRVKAAEIDRVAQALYDSGMDQVESTAMSISAELVSQFLLPEAEKMAVRADEQHRQRRVQVGAHRELLEGVKVLEQRVSSARASRRPSAQRLRSAGALVETESPTTGTPATEEHESVAEASVGASPEPVGQDTEPVGTADTGDDDTPTDAASEA